jgi:translation initiation factor 3 subunit E
MASYDLTAVLAKNLDKHLVFPLLEFLSMKKIYPEADIEKAKIELVQKTNMIDFLMDIWTSHYNKPEPPAEFQERRHQVVEKLSTLQASFKI